MTSTLSISDLSQIVTAIVNYQMELVGPLAVDQVGKVKGIKITNRDRLEIEILDTEEPKALLERVVAKYEELFGRASVEACKEAIHEGPFRINEESLPEILKH